MKPQSAGGKAVVASRGVEYMRKIGAEGGHRTVERYGVGYMAQIASCGALKKRLRREAEWRSLEPPMVDLDFVEPEDEGW